MNQDILYQNREIGNSNPLTGTASPVKNKFQLPSDPKIKILLISGMVIIFLLITSAIVSLSRKSSSQTGSATPTPTAISASAPTEIPDSAIPTELKSKFDQINKYNQTNIHFSPPQIDSKIGSS
jgi:hypothetical protein